jgi:hypothetical protein
LISFLADQNNRVKRESQNETSLVENPHEQLNETHGDDEEPDALSGGHGQHHGFHILKPGAFTARIGQGVALEVVTLSPFAFFSEVLFPEALLVSFWVEILIN